jgi:predicted MFS family arabinose efflux permease
LTHQSKEGIICLHGQQYVPPLTILRHPGWPHAPRRAWLAVSAIALGSFALVVTELLPIALIGPVASDLQVSEGTAGLMVALPAIVAAVVALAVSVLAGRTDRKLL